MYEKLKSLSRIEIAAIKRNLKNVEHSEKKIATLEKKKAEIEAEIEIYQNQLELWENPVIELTGGIKTKDALNYLQGDFPTDETIEFTEDVKVEETPVAPEESSAVEEVKPEETPLNVW